MAIFRMAISSVSRSAGRRATAAAAYRSGERIRDERTGELFNQTRRRDVLHTEILLPAHFDGEPVEWARNRERLWNTAEHAEKRHNSRVAREFQVSLPAELDAVRRVALARTLAREIADRYKVAGDLAVHEPRPDGDPRNFHAHLLTTTREVTPAGLVNRQIHGNFVAVRDLARKIAGKRHALDSLQLGGQRDLKFARYPRVVALLRVLGRVPQPLAASGPGDRHTVELSRQKDFRMQHIPPARIIEKLTGAFIPNALARAIGGCGRGAPARAARH